MKRQVTAILLLFSILTVISCNGASPTPLHSITSNAAEESLFVVTETVTTTLTSVTPRIITTTTDYWPPVNSLTSTSQTATTKTTTQTATSTTTYTTTSTPSTTPPTAIPTTTNTVPTTTGTIPSTTATTSTTTTTATPTQSTTTNVINIPIDGDYTEAVVIGIIDGDTIDVEISGSIKRVRYIGVNTPELKDTRQEYRLLAEEARIFNKQLVEGKMVKLVKDISEVDTIPQPRLLRYVYVDDIFVNAELVSKGYARATPYTPDIKYHNYFNQLELEAQQTRLGIWHILHVTISMMFYDGTVSSKEPDEYVEITNIGDTPQNLKGWTLLDISDGKPVFEFPDFVLEPQKSIRVYTNEVHPEFGGFTFGSSSSIWNNSDPDIAVFYDSEGNEVSRKTY